MNIGVVSDTHRYTPSIEKVIDKIQDVDLLIHLGDNIEDVDNISQFYNGRIINVKGNCDFKTDMPSEKIEIIDDKKFFITHGHRYDVKYDISRLKYRAFELNADIVLFGHTHISFVAFEDGIWFINPGSPSLARDGFNSIAIINIENGKISPGIINV
ncbi:metallophosphoesterase [Clostridium fermenticellae]|uniref:Phosphoesterase n=1 Tax=Clostridium fermenticellae TaxID=2068654 RepID=A0A386H1Q9_9CLOT|nr:metallophosphoesterase [Clostridium fermenticellae]AYD39594.1 metallophosphoesterase [Clostridium fermenticellae]